MLHAETRSVFCYYPLISRAGLANKAGVRLNLYGADDPPPTAAELVAVLLRSVLDPVDTIVH